MRILVWLALGFAAGCGYSAYCWQEHMLPLLLAATGLALISFLLALRFRKLLPVFLILLGIAAGLGWFQLFYDLHLESLQDIHGREVTVEAELRDYCFETEYGCSADAELTLDGKVYKTRLYLDECSAYPPGTKLTGTFRLAVTLQDQELSHHPGVGLFLFGYQKGDLMAVEPDRIPLRFYPAVLRRSLISSMDAAFPEDTAAFARALLLGDKSGLSYELSTAFKVSGISHIIAVSGQHVAILFALVYVLGGKRRFLTGILGIPVILLFMAVTGFSPSVVRAGIMQILVLLALLFAREYDPPTALAFACLVILAANPMAVTSVSLQLSVACVVGIFLFYSKLYTFFTQKLHADTGKSLFSQFLRGIAGSVAMTLSTTVMATPLAAFYFGAVSLVGVLTNLLVLPLVAVVFYGCMAVCAVAAVSLPVAAVIGQVLSWPIRLILNIARILSQVPFGALYLKSIYVFFFLVFAYLLLGLFLIFKRKSPAVLALCLLAGLVCTLALSWLEPRLDSFRVTVLDVGQGQSVLIQADGRNYLVDCGSDYEAGAADAAAETLLSQGCDRLDGIIISHYDRDHCGGVPLLLTRIRADAIYLPEVEDTTIWSEKLQACGVPVVWLRETLKLQWGSAMLTVAGPVISDNRNESSLAVLFQKENCDILITGDRTVLTEEILLRQIQIPELEILVVGHHGSRYSTGDALLAATMPDIAVISVGEHNRYGHPDEEVLQRLANYGCRILRTDEMGSIVFRR